MAGVAESVVEVGLDAPRGHRGRGEDHDLSVDFAHRLANASHLASTLAGGRARSRVALGAAAHPELRRSGRAPGSAEHSIEVKQHSARPRLGGLGGPGRGRLGLPRRRPARDAAHAAAAATRAASSTERLLPSPTFAALDRGFAMLHRPPWAVDGVAARAQSATGRVASRSSSGGSSIHSGQRARVWRPTTGGGCPNNT